MLILLSEEGGSMGVIVSGNLYLVYFQDMNLEFASLWTPYANFTDDQRATMTEAGYYSILVREGLRVLSFNTNYW